MSRRVFIEKRKPAEVLRARYLDVRARLVPIRIVVMPSDELPVAVKEPKKC